jgi:hypothetical protein
MNPLPDSIQTSLPVGTRNVSLKHGNVLAYSVAFSKSGNLADCLN